MINNNRNEEMVSNLYNKPVYVISEVYAETVIIDPGYQDEVRVRKGHRGNRHQQWQFPCFPLLPQISNKNGVLFAARDTKLKLDAVFEKKRN